MKASLLIELLTEELPPKALNLLGNSFANAVVEGLEKAQLIEQSEFIAYAAPRRLAVWVKNVQSVQQARVVIKKGPSVAASMKEGRPTKALEGFARSCGVEIENLIIQHDGKQDIYAYEYTQQGQTLTALINDILAQAIKKLPIPKVMRWGSSTHTFVRPVHGLLMMHGSALLVGNVLGLESRNWTLGHRFLSSEKIVLNHADDYSEKMRCEGKVIAQFDERKNLIKQGLQNKARALNVEVAAGDDLLNEVSALVEWPVVLEAGFDAQFLNVPQECLILTMQQNQKYFPLLDKSGKLINRFLLVANIEPDNQKHIINGNERVLRARLSDAAFFYQQDKKVRLESRLPKLANVVYHNQLGNQLQRVKRIVAISRAIAEKIHADVDLTQRAAYLAKADLLTEMVGEFPELQGIMGHYYAILDGENPIVAQAIEQHYLPRFAGDKLPETNVATAVALADKLETLVGIWGIGLIPTGDKDPYALRRAALGIIRMLMRYNVAYPELLQIAFDVFPENKLAENTIEQVGAFIQTRLAVLLQNDYASDVVAAVLAKEPIQFYDLKQKLQAVELFKQLPEASALAAANKRVQNLLKKTEAALGTVDTALLQQVQEQALFQALTALEPKIHLAIQEHDFSKALNQLATLKPQVDDFFNHVMVMSDDIVLKQNRLNLLNQLYQLLNAVADISQLHE